MKKTAIFAFTLLIILMSFKKDRDKEAIAISQTEFKVALIMPLYLKNPSRRKNDTTQIIYDYYEGVQIAIGELNKLGIKMKLFVFDDQMDSFTVDSIFKLEKMKEMNTIIGPFFKFHEIGEKFCGTYQIPLVSPFKHYKRKTKTVFPHINFIACDSISAFGEGMGIARAYPTQQLIILNNGKPENYHHRKLFKEGYNRVSNLEITTINETDIAKINTIVATKTNTIVYAPTANLNVINQLAILSKANKIILCLPSESKKIEGFGKKGMTAANAHFGDNTYYNIYDLATLNFRKLYRAQFRWEANIYHFSGYDHFKFIGQSLMTFHQFYPQRLKEAKFDDGLMHTFLLKSSSYGSFENAGCKIVKYASNSNEKILINQK